MVRFIQRFNVCQYAALIFQSDVQEFALLKAFESFFKIRAGALL